MWEEHTEILRIMRRVEGENKIIWLFVAIYNKEEADALEKNAKVKIKL